MQNLLLGACTGTVAATVCYPLDTVRRRMQMKGITYNGQLHAMQSIWANVRPHIASRVIDNSVRHGDLFSLLVAIK